MNNRDREQLFKGIDNLLNEFQIYSVQDRFRIINEYQSSRLDKIEQANNDANRMALGRTSMYELDRVLKDCSKRKNKDFFRLVNIFCIGITDFDQITGCSGLEQNVFEYILENKNIVLENIDWYRRVIPESIWLIRHLKELTNKQETPEN